MTVAEVNLKFIWDVVSQIQVGKAGHAYVVDARGNLIAHPDISLVLQKTDLAALTQVATARAPRARAPGERRDEATIARDLQRPPGPHRLGADPPLGWLVFVELPLAEASRRCTRRSYRTAVLLAARPRPRRCWPASCSPGAW